MTKNNQDEKLQELLSHFIQEIKAENKQLVTKLSEAKQEKIKEKKAPTIPNHLKPMLEKQEKRENQDTLHSNAPFLTEHVETSMESKIVQLSEQGLSIDEIAKQLNKGKTEVELILKLNERMIVNT